MSYVQISGVTKSFGDVLAVDDVSFEAERGEFVSLLGPSGCGKTTTLRMIAGLETPTSGTIEIGGEVVTEQPPYERDIGMVFQHYALFPHKTVGENVGFPLKMRGVGKEERRERVADALEMVRLPGMMDRSPTELSGGQQQRVALARALVFEPNVLLMDEPLSALDRVLRQKMRIELERIQEEIGITTIYVTHDQMEAFSLSDRVIVLDQGELSQQGSPLDIYENPQSEFVGEFIGQSTKLSGTVASADDGVALETDSGLLLESTARDLPVNSSALAFLRAEKLSISKEPTGVANELKATVTTVSYLGEKTLFFCTLSTGEEITVAEHGFTGVDKYESGDEVYVTIPAEKLLLVEDGPDGGPR
ncbi:ATP-binding cassette domain-containing protein [Haloferax sp. MBLA0076]|uniref:Molybdate/tungstate import ATP-binding protein WtpC n=1 Tax=Haloferax litoreum TaxID=2666140 RepID=A0A6A8GMN2_9EURY|nr:MULTISPECIES: ABC transporter ATP-binding protein [Haloferax]KAB1190570.1 ABC transporter ATP-binding protein [Haloferax sp. CBA1148]MRX23557.1 ATP-binding cassette domain-containing protein [Haloferax litoreum]